MKMVISSILFVSVMGIITAPLAQQVTEQPAAPAVPTLPGSSTGNAPAARPATRLASEEELIPFTFENVQLSSIIKVVAEASGRSFLVQTPISGTALIYCPKMISINTAFDILGMILDSQGYTMVVSEDPPVVFVTKKVGGESLPTEVMVEGEGTRPDKKHRLATMAVALKYISVDDMQDILRNFKSPSCVMTAHRAANFLILKDEEARLQYLLSLIKNIDVPSPTSEVTIVELKYADASEMASLLMELMAGMGSGQVATPVRRVAVPSPRPGAPQPAVVSPTIVGKAVPLKIIPDVRTNRLVILAPEKDTEYILDLVKRLDVEAPREVKASQEKAAPSHDPGRVVEAPAPVVSRQRDSRRRSEGRTAPARSGRATRGTLRRAATRDRQATDPAEPASPRTARRTADEMIPFTFENVQLPTIVKLVAETTGRNFLLQTPTAGTALTYCPKLIPRSAAFDVLRVILDVQGYTMVESENPPLVYVARKVSAPETLPSPTAPHAAARSISEEELIPFTFENVQLATVIKSVAETAGRSFVIQTPIAGTVTIYCPKKIPPSTAFDMLRIIVDTQGYAMEEMEDPPLVLVAKKPPPPEKPEAPPAAAIEKEPTRPPKIVEPPPPPPPLQWELLGLTKIRGDYLAVIRDRSRRTRGGFLEYLVREGDEVPGHFGVSIVSMSPGPPATVKYDRAGVGVEELTMGEPPHREGARKQQWEDIIAPVREGYTYLVKLRELERDVPSAEAYRETFSLEPGTEGGKVTGLKITSLPRDNLLYAAGLRQGDVIESIGEESITDEAAALALLRSAAKGFSLQLGIIRGRTKRSITYTFLKK